MTPYTGRLPDDEGAASARAGEVAAGDLDRASVLDVSGMELVTSVVTLRNGLPDLVLEAASTIGLKPVRLESSARFFSPPGNEPVYLVGRDDLQELVRFVSSVAFVNTDRLSAFMHAVVVRHPADNRPPAATEPVWVESKLWAAGLVRLTLDPGWHVPDGVLLWTVGLERSCGPDTISPYWSTRLASGFAAHVEVENRT